MAEDAHTLQRIYGRRFEQTAAYRDRVWQVLTKSFFSRWVKPSHVVLDLGCGYGEFVNNIQARRKLAMDLNPAAAERLSPEVDFLHQDCAAPWPVDRDSLDVVFTSNFLEHLPDKAHVRTTVQHAIRSLRPGGHFIALGPNIATLHGAYWDFFDHHVALTESSLSELLHLEGAVVEHALPRFLPYTLVNAPEYPLVFVRWYLKWPALWKLWGRQFLVVARKPAHAVACVSGLLHIDWAYSLEWLHRLPLSALGV